MSALTNMPILKDFRQTKIIELPNWKGSQVEIYDSLLVGDMARIDTKSSNAIEQVVNSLHMFIKSWNFTDEQGNTLEINRENLNFLKADDVQVITEAVAAFNLEVKKKQSS